MNSFYTSDELITLGFKSIGENVLISKKASIYSAEKISIAGNVRIDDFCILSGKISIGNYVHIAAYSCLYGGVAGVQIDDFANISSRVAIYAVSDDYHGHGMTNPMVPEKYRKVVNESVTINKHVIVGSGSTILPGVTLKHGASVGAMSLVNKDCDEFTIYVGIPAKPIKKRSRQLLLLEDEFLNK